MTNFTWIKTRAEAEKVMNKLIADYNNGVKVNGSRKQIADMIEDLRTYCHLNRIVTFTVYDPDSKPLSVAELNRIDQQFAMESTHRAIQNSIQFNNFQIYGHF